MSQTRRFPFPRNVPNVSPAEFSQIITILPATDTFTLGGEPNYVSVAPWKTVGDRNTETPYNCVAIEFITDEPMTIGNGTTDLIGLYGQIDLVSNPTVASDRKRTLLAILGVNLLGAAPQIPIVVQAGPGDLVGYTQLVSNVAVYDRLSIGGVIGNVALPIEATTVTVVARPIRARDYLG
jgi:hypothetical protein